MAYIKGRKHVVVRALPQFGGVAAATACKTDTSANTNFTAPLVDTPQTIQVIRGRSFASRARRR